MIIFYHLFLWLFRGGVFIASLFNRKARLFIQGRVNLLHRVKKEMKPVTGRVVWMHCASLGEFEQGKPVLKKIMENYPDVVPVVSFFSPSGYEIIRKKKEFPHVFYLPVDSYVNASQWMKFIKPSLVLWVKYEYWHFYLKAIQRKKIPLLMVSGIYRRNQVFFRWYGGVYRKMLDAFSHFFVQNDSSRRFLSLLIDKNKITVSGDTRCDRVIEIAENFTPIPEIDLFTENHRVVVCGSTWEADEAIWVHYVNTHPEIRFIIAPHEIHNENISHIKSIFKSSVTFSEWRRRMSHPSPEETQHPNCLIIDNIGMLSRLYYYANVTYVGGGFGDNGLHNILEAAVFAKPVIFGPAIYKNFEADELIMAGGGISVHTALDLEKIMDDLFSDPLLSDTKGRAAAEYVRKSSGATRIISDYIREKGIL